MKRVKVIGLITIFSAISTLCESFTTALGFQSRTHQLLSSRGRSRSYHIPPLTHSNTYSEDGFSEVEKTNHSSQIASNDKENKDVPSVRRIIDFAIPAIGIYLCSPLLSMIDTSTVGLFSGTIQQAALNPAITITDYSARTMSFLYTGTTNLIAKTSGGDKDWISDMFLGSLQLAALVGAGLAAFLFITSPKLLKPLIGNENVEVELLHGAWRYVAIRALGMPAAAMIGTSQAACLGLQDNKTPFKIIATTAIINFLLDIVLVGQKIVWLGGTAGAAWATTISQYIALFLFLRRFADDKNSNGRNPKLSTKGFLHGRLTWRKFMKLPCKETREEFKPYLIPVTTTQIGRCSTYIAMGHVVSSTLDTVSMAAQQIITSIFYALIPIGDSCSLAAQTFVPPLLSKDPSEDRTRSLKMTIKNIFKVACIVGGILSAITLTIPLACPLLTNDEAVMTIVKHLVPLQVGIFATHGIFCASEGILLGFRDLKFLGNIYAAFFVIVPMLMLRLKYLARSNIHHAISLRSVWNVFLWYQAFRILTFLGRVAIVRKQHAK